MKPAERIPLIFGVAILGAGAFSFYRGRRGTELLTETALHGLSLGTGLNVVAWLASEGEVSEIYSEAETPSYEAPLLALKNTAEGMGKLSSQAVALLSELDTGTLYAAMKRNGVKVAPVPENPSIVVQDED